MVPRLTFFVKTVSQKLKHGNIFQRRCSAFTCNTTGPLHIMLATIVRNAVFCIELGLPTVCFFSLCPLSFISFRKTLIHLSKCCGLPTCQCPLISFLHVLITTFHAVQFLNGLTIQVAVLYFSHLCLPDLPLLLFRMS